MPTVTQPQVVLPRLAGADSGWDGAWRFSFMHFSLEDSYRVCRVKNDGTPRSHFPRKSPPPRHSIAAAHAAIDASTNEMSAL